VVRIEVLALPAAMTSAASGSPAKAAISGALSSAAARNVDVAGGLAHPAQRASPRLQRKAAGTALIAGDHGGGDCPSRR